MNELQRETLSRIIGPTRNIVDLEKCKAALAYSRSIGIESECKRMIISSRLYWLNWHAMTQRRWQRDTRNPNKARHHDSIALREKYVRCQA